MKTVFILLFFFITNRLFAINTIILSAGNSGYPIGLSLEILEDKEGKLTLVDVRNPEQKNLWVKSNQEVPSFGYTKSAYWVRFKTNAPLDEKYLLEIAFPNLDWIDFYTILNDNSVIVRKSGDFRAFKERDVMYRNFTFTLEPHANIEKEYYIRFAGEGSLQIPLIIWSPIAFAEKVNNEMFGLGLYYGGMLVMAIYNLFLWLSVRDKSYFYYVIYIFTSAFFLLSNTGILYQYFWFGSPAVYNLLIPTSMYMTHFSVIIFTGSFLQIKKNIPFLYKILKYLFLILIITLFIVLPISFRLTMLSGILFGIISILLCLYAGIIMVKRRYRPAIFYLVAWTALLIGAIILSLKTVGVLPVNAFTNYAMQVSSALEVVLLSLGLADRINDLKKQNELAQAQILTNQSLAIDSLEKIAKEKTNKLNQSLKIIQRDLSLAQKIQQNILLTDPDILKILKITPYYIPMSQVGGDIYQISQLNDSTYRIFLADATGHGVQAAMITMAIQSVYENIKDFDVEISQVMEIFNSEYLYKYKSLISYVTAILVEIDVKKESPKYVSAGHPPAVLLQNNQIHKLGYTGRMIGLSQNNKYKSSSFSFSKSDRLFIFTDGIFEQFNTRKEEFGEERIISILAENRHLTINETIQVALGELNTFLEGFETQDDITILGVEYSQ